MTEHTKNKIAFAVGLLAVLFTLTPLLSDFGRVGFVVFEFSLTLSQLYVFLSATLSISVYCYGLQFLLPRFRFPTTFGDVFYAIGLVAPTLFAALFLIAKLFELAAPLLRNTRIVEAIQTSLSAIAGVIATVISYRVRRILDLGQRQAERQHRTEQETSILNRAEDLLKHGNYDLAVIEAFRALEMAGRAHPSVSNAPGPKPKTEWFRLLLQSLPADIRPALESARVVRNNAAHAVDPISESSATSAVSTIGKALALLADSRSDTCPQCGSRALIEESGVDSGFHWTRKRCTRCGYLDLS